MLGDCIDDLDGSRRRFNPKSIRAVIRPLGTVSSLIVMAAVRESAPPEENVPPPSLFTRRASDRAKATIFDAAVYDLEILYVLKIQAKFIQMMNVKIFQYDIGVFT